MWPFTRPDLDKIDLHLQFWTAEPDTPYTLRLTVDKLDVVEALGVVRGSDFRLSNIATVPVFRGKGLGLIGDRHPHRGGADPPVQHLHDRRRLTPQPGREPAVPALWRAPPAAARERRPFGLPDQALKPAARLVLASAGTRAAPDPDRQHSHRRADTGLGEAQCGAMQRVQAWMQAGYDHHHPD
jgi:hypothetical protein